MAGLKALAAVGADACAGSAVGAGAGVSAGAGLRRRSRLRSRSLLATLQLLDSIFQGFDAGLVGLFHLPHFSADLFQFRLPCRCRLNDAGQAG